MIEFPKKCNSRAQEARYLLGAFKYQRKYMMWQSIMSL